MKPDLFQSPDYYNLDDLLNEEHKLVRDSARAWVKREVSPIIEEYAQRAEFPKQIIKGLGEIGGFGPYIPVEYGGAGLDQISYGLIMQEIERGDSGVRSTSSVQSSLVMYPIWKYGNEEQRMKYLPKLATGEFIGCFGCVWHFCPKLFDIAKCIFIILCIKSERFFIVESMIFKKITGIMKESRGLRAILFFNDLTCNV